MGRSRREMSKTLKETFAKTCLVIAIVLFILGLFLLCACPGWYALASLFAGLAVWLNSGRRFGYWLLLASCLAVMALHFFAKMHEDKVNAERMQRIKNLAGTEISLIEQFYHPDE
jgi:membrane protein implicated in regulation of membrane protease activity